MRHGELRPDKELSESAKERLRQAWKEEWKGIREKPEIVKAHARQGSSLWCRIFGHDWKVYLPDMYYGEIGALYQRCNRCSTRRWYSVELGHRPWYRLRMVDWTWLLEGRWSRESELVQVNVDEVTFIEVGS